MLLYNNILVGLSTINFAFKEGKLDILNTLAKGQGCNKNFIPTLLIGKKKKLAILGTNTNKLQI